MKSVICRSGAICRLWMNMLVEHSVKNWKHTIPLDIDRAYIAGFFDGEGCISIDKHPGLNGVKYYNVQVSIVNTDLKTLEYISKFYPVNIGIHSPLKSWHKVRFKWAINGKKAILFLEEILPFLRQKRERAEIAIHFEKNKKRCLGLNPGRHQKGKILIPKEELDWRLNHYNRIKELNKRGR